MKLIYKNYSSTKKRHYVFYVRYGEILDFRLAGRAVFNPSILYTSLLPMCEDERCTSNKKY